jgi:hypothetical protein
MATSRPSTFDGNEWSVRRVETALNADEPSAHRFDAAIDGAEPTLDPSKLWPNASG